MSEKREFLSVNEHPINQLSLQWLNRLKADYSRSHGPYLVTLAQWGLNEMNLPTPLGVDRYSLAMSIDLIPESDPSAAKSVMNWLMTNPNVGDDQKEQEADVLGSLQAAETPEDAAMIAVDVVVSRMQAQSPRWRSVHSRQPGD